MSNPPTGRSTTYWVKSTIELDAGEDGACPEDVAMRLPGVLRELCPVP